MVAYPEIPAGYGLARMHWSAPGGDGHAYCLLGVRNASALTAASVAANVGNAYATSLLENLTSDYTFTDVEATVNNGGVLSQDTAAFGDAGPNPAPSVPINVSVLVRKQTGLIGREFRGRFYFPGLEASSVDSTAANLTSDALTSWQSDALDFYNNLGTGLLVPYLLHRNTAVPPTKVLNFEVEQLLATQRRRLRKAAHR